ncbi:redoxin domain-containing protein [Paenibacillus wynnii]|uniref:redoxin domain-containing protein n=1 Tax=Paenibacillus wynnii TaxID=268407 RepID=UPI0027920DCA|nr:redoxin domain-containing protein [Paenibacillus wynnii]MDQ0196873.1 peroxiredoxin [Paenibacillus wynnii]
MELNKGLQAPLFVTKDVFGNTVDLNTYRGQKVMVSFYRFASCPFCNLRIQRILGNYSKFEEQGLRMISFWQSPANSILEHVGQQHLPFPMIPDPEKNFYRLYHVENSWIGALKVMREPGLVMKALKGRFNPLEADGDMNQLPADFLLNPDLTIHTAYYGEHIGDHIEFAEIERFLGIL